MTHYSVQPRDKISIKGYGLLSLAKNNRNNKQAIFKNCIAFTKCITEINDAQIDNAKDLDVVNSMCNSTKYSKHYSHIPGSLWQYYRDEPANPITNSASFRFKSRLLNNNNNYGIIDAETAMPLKYLHSFGEVVKYLN